MASVHVLKGDSALGQRVNAEAEANARLIAAAPDLTGEQVWFDADFRILTDDEVKARLRAGCANA